MLYLLGEEQEEEEEGGGEHVKERKEKKSVSTNTYLERGCTGSSWSYDFAVSVNFFGRIAENYMDNSP